MDSELQRAILSGDAVLVRTLFNGFHQDVWIRLIIQEAQLPLRTEEKEGKEAFLVDVLEALIEHRPPWSALVRGVVALGLMRFGRVMVSYMAVEDVPDILPDVVMSAHDVRPLLRILVARGASLRHDMTLAMRAYRRDTLEFLLTHGVEVNQALISFIQSAPLQSPDHVATIIRLGARVNYQDVDGSNAALLAAQRDWLEVIEVLRAQGADMDLKNRQGLSASQVLLQRDSNQIHTLEGPVLVQRFRLEDKVIHLFYDHHFYRQPCAHSTHIVDFMDRFLRRSSDVVDFILETYENPSQHRTIDNVYLQRLRRWFNHCFDRQTRNQFSCRYPRARFHFNDWRFNPGTMLNSLARFHETRQPALAREFLLRVLGGGKNLHSHDLWDAVLRHEMRLEKQLASCPAPVQEVIRGWMTKMLESEETHWFPGESSRTVLSTAFFQWLDQPVTDAVIYRDAGWYLMAMGMIYMDAYTMARMFRRFRAVPGQYSGPMRNILVYAGVTHCQNYAALIQQLGGQLEAQSTPSSVCTPDHWAQTGSCQCQDVTALLPWAMVPTD